MASTILEASFEDAAVARRVISVVPADFTCARKNTPQLILNSIRLKTNESSGGKDKGKEKAAAKTEDRDQNEACHFIGYVHAYGKVWELDGLKSGQLEVGELPLPLPSTSTSQQDHPPTSVRWMGEYIRTS